jgi:hypothetical protein
MKVLLALLFLCFSLRADTITLAWNYPTNELSTNLTFNLYHSLAVTNPLPWMMMTNTVGTNLNCKVDIIPGEHYFYVTASNFWGESLPSNILGLPPGFKRPADTKATRP